MLSVKALGGTPMAVPLPSSAPTYGLGGGHVPPDCLYSLDYIPYEQRDTSCFNLQLYSLIGHLPCNNQREIKNEWLHFRI